MKPLRFVLLAVPLAVATIGNAYGYANATPPSEFGGSGTTSWNWRATASRPWVNGISTGSAIVNAGGRSVAVPVAASMASNAAKAVAVAARSSPAGFIATAVAAWLLTEGFAYLNDQWTITGQTTGAPYYCVVNSDCINGNRFQSLEEAASKFESLLCTGRTNCSVARTYFGWAPVNGTSSSASEGGGLNYAVTSQQGNLTGQVRWTVVCPVGAGNLAAKTGYGTPYTCTGQTNTGSRPATTTDWDHFDNEVLPDAVANAAGAPIPVNRPVMNPNGVGAPSPITVPTAEPEAMPGTSPQSYRQPVVDVIPAATDTEPWRVDVQPREIITNSPTGVPDPSTTTPPPSGGGAPVEVDIELCGLPGTPPCKIDESGTAEPDASKDIEADTKAAQKPLDDLIENPTSVVPEFPSLSWDFALPTGCTVIQIPAFAPFLTGIDVCRFQPIFHDIMSMVWVIGGLFGAISMFWRNTLSS